MAEYIVATRATLGLIASAGNNASPSFDIAFPICADNGKKPAINIVVTNSWGPNQLNKLSIQNIKKL